MRVERDQDGKIIAITEREAILYRTTVEDPTITSSTNNLRKGLQRFVDNIILPYLVGDGYVDERRPLYSDLSKKQRIKEGTNRRTF